MRFLRLRATNQGDFVAINEADEVVAEGMDLWMDAATHEVYVGDRAAVAAQDPFWRTETPESA